MVERVYSQPRSQGPLFENGGCCCLIENQEDPGDEVASRLSGRAAHFQSAAHRLQSRTKLLRHFGVNENFDLENHLPQQIVPPLSLINVALPPKFP